MDYRRETYKERDRNPINRWINRRLDTITERETEKYVQRYAMGKDGRLNEELAERIRFEVLRRSEMGREIDVLEPGRWTVFSFLLGLGTGTAAKAVEQRNAAPPALKGFLRATAIAGFAASALTGGRILSFARFKAGLYAGAQTALASYQRQQGNPLLALPQAENEPQGKETSLPSWSERHEKESISPQGRGRS